MIGNIIEVDKNGVPVEPEIILTKRSGTIIGHIENASNVVMSFHMASPNEISFDVYKFVDGVICNLWEEIKDFRFVYVPHYKQWYEIHVTINESSGIIKHVSGLSVYESELSQLILNEVEVGTEDDLDYMNYNEGDEIVIYNPKNPNLSILHRILRDKATHYSIFHVDSSIAKLVRSFSWDDTSIYDAFNAIAEEVECLFLFGESKEDDDKLHRTISVYDLKDVCLECGSRDVENGICPVCGSTSYIRGYGYDSGVFVSRENLTPDITYDSNMDEIKNCFWLVAGDDDMTADAIALNPSGSPYIWHFSDQTLSEMSASLRNALNELNTKTSYYANEYEINIDVTEYNTLVDKYKKWNEDLSTAESPIIGYTGLSDLYYKVDQLNDFLSVTMYPAAEAARDTTAEKEMELIDISVIGIGTTNLNTFSRYSAEDAVKKHAKAAVDTSRYRVSVTTNLYENPTWTGTVTLESYTDDDDKDTSEPFTVTFVNDNGEYLKSLIDLKMGTYEGNKVGIKALFAQSEDDFKTSLEHYSLAGLSNILSVCNACCEVLINAGVGDEGHEYYQDFYYPYYQKQGWIQEEIDLRASEIEYLTNDIEETGLLEIVNAERDKINDELDIESNLTETQWTELASFRRDQKYTNDNYIAEGLTPEKRLERAQQFLDTAKKELKKASEPKHQISGSLYDFLLLVDDDPNIDNEIHYVLGTHDRNYIMTNLDEYIEVYNPLFAPIVRNFELGNWMHLEIDTKVYKLRLTDFDLDFSDIGNLNVTFADAVELGGFIDDTATILKSAASISTTYNYFTHQATDGESANRELTDINTNGMALDQRRIVTSSDKNNQSLLIDDHGILMREPVDYGDGYDPEQVRIINKGLYYTNDGWETVGTGIGSFTYTDPETGETISDFGVIAKTIVGRLILGEQLGIYNENGSMKIDDNGFTLTSRPDGYGNDIFTVRRDNGDGTYDQYIYVNDSGEVIIDGNNVRVGHDDEQMTIVDYIDENLVPGADGYDGVDGESQLSVVIESSAGNIFKNNNIEATLIARVYLGQTEITSDATSFTWIRKDQDGVIDQSWTRTTVTNTTTITSADVFNKAVFECEVTLPGDDEEEEGGE